MQRASFQLQHPAGIEAMRKELPQTEEITEIIRFIEQSERGIIR
jgi:acyl-[acyl carrier protein]--UDP-N-acetylglucosamine O-acyltransferase